MNKVLLCLAFIVLAIVVLTSCGVSGYAGGITQRSRNTQPTSTQRTSTRQASVSPISRRSSRPLRDPEKLQRVNQEWKSMDPERSEPRKITWRDEETSKELASVEKIPNRYGDLPDVAHLRPTYLPDQKTLNRLANGHESALSDVAIYNKSRPDVSMNPDHSLLFEND